MTNSSTNLATRPLGGSGLEVSTCGLGGNNFSSRVDLAGTRAVVDAALTEGVNFIDTSNSYGRGRSEELLGDVLKGRRDQVVLATKFGWDIGDGVVARGSRAYIREAVQESLRRLQTDVIDVYWYHRPDGVTPIAETLETLDELVRAGTVRAVGASNFTVEAIEEAEAASRERGLTRFEAVQNEYNLLEREAEHDMLPTCERLGLGFVPYFPLASGLLTGRYRRGAEGPSQARLSGREQIATDEQFDLIEGLERYAEERGVTLTDVAIAALLARRPVASVIAGATRPDQVHANAAAARWEPSEDDLAVLRELLDG
jgi:aryl-alcohol dehydrogenase-like predicted oxidoreductase